MSLINMLDSENTMVRHESVIATFTRFKGTILSEVLENRLKEIIQLNPWIGSKLIESSEGKLMFKVPNSIDDMSPYLKIYDIKHLLNNQANIDELLDTIRNETNPNLIKKLYVVPTEQCINKDVPLIKFSFVFDNETEEFVMIYSMNHIVGDGTSYYQLFKMMSSDEEIKTLNFNRKHEFSRAELPVAESQHKTKEQEKKKKIGFGKVINLDLIQKIKEKNNATFGERWVSTHDIITSMLFNSLKSDKLFYPINSRSHLSYLDDYDVGNYVDVIVIDSSDESTAKDIRQSINDFKAGLHDISDKLKDSNGDTKTAVFTSWIQNYKTLILGSHCKQNVHFPLLPRNLYGKNTGSLDHLVVLFCLNESTWMLCGVTTNTNWLENNELFID